MYGLYKLNSLLGNTSDPGFSFESEVIPGNIKMAEAWTAEALGNKGIYLKQANKQTNKNTCKEIKSTHPLFLTFCLSFWECLYLKMPPVKVPQDTYIMHIGKIWF